MACSGGCIGGGGQPVPTTNKLRAKRAAALYEIDKNLPIRTAHDNPMVQEIYKKYFSTQGGKSEIEDLVEKMFHTRYEEIEKKGI